MNDYSNSSLGAVVRERRIAAGFSQSELASKAGYGAGGAVSVSRIETGVSRPSEPRLSGIAKALGVNADAIKREAIDRETAGTDREAAPGASDARSIRVRMEHLQRVLDERQENIDSRSDRINTAHDSASERFLLPLIEFAERVEGAPELPRPQELSATEKDPESLAEARVEATWFDLAQALLRVGASSGLLGAGLSIATTNTMRRFFGIRALSAGRSGLLGGALGLGGIVALPAAAAAMLGFAFMSRRNKAKSMELETNISEAESQIAATQPGYLALIEALDDAAQVLEYIGNHGAHALTKWTRSLPEGKRNWADLSPQDQDEARNFIRVAACHVAVASVDYSLFLTLNSEPASDPTEMDPGRSDRDRYIEETGHLIAAARRTVEELV